MITDLNTGVVISRNARYAADFLSRLLGLMGRRSFPRSCDALIFEHCSSIHCFFMRMEIDVIFIDRYGRVIRTFSRLKPWRLAFGGSGTKTVIELPAGTLEHSGTAAGNCLKFE